MNMRRDVLANISKDLNMGILSVSEARRSRTLGHQSDASCCTDESKSRYLLTAATAGCVTKA